MPDVTTASGAAPPGGEVNMGEAPSPWESVLRATCEHAPHLAGVVDLDGTVRYANDAACSLLAIEPSDAVGRPFWDCPWWTHDPAERDKLRDAIRRAATATVQFETTHRAADGSLRQIDFSVRPVRDETGVVCGLLAEGRDITAQRLAEARLRAHVALLQAMVSNAPVILYAFDREGIFTLSEGKGLATMGLRPGQIVGMSAFEVYRDRPDTHVNFHRALAGESFTVPVRFGRCVLDAYHEPVWGPNGEYAGTVGVLVDVTGRADAEAALERANRRLRMLSDCNQAMIRAADEAELLSTICSIVVEVGGYRMAWVGFADDDEARTVRPIAQAGDDDGYLATARVTWADEGNGRGPIGTAIRTGKASAFQNILHDEAFVPWRREAARRGYQSVCGLPISLAGRTAGALGVYSSEPEAFDPEEVALLTELAGDLAFGIAALRTGDERIRAEAALHTREERFRRLVLNSTGLIAVCDEEGGVTSVNGPVELTLGFALDELVGRSAFDLVHPDDVAGARHAFAETVRRPGSTARREFRSRRKDGTWVWCEAVATNLLDDDLVRGIVLNVRDITERKAAELERIALQNQLQQAMKMEAVGRLAGGVAHDFNNLLTAIMGNVELARLDLSAADPLRQYLDGIGKASESAAALTGQLLAFSRRQMVEPRPLSLNDLVKNLEQVLTRVIGEDVQLRCTLSDDLGSVRVDPGQFEQVLVNLVVNARDAMPHGGVLLIETANVELDADYCARHAASTPGSYVLLAISDTGEGMTDEVKAHLFEPFFTTKPQGRGTGLGLATTFGAVSQAGGTIEVYSERGCGTSLRIYLPRVPEPPARLEPALARERLPAGTETVLLVEDDKGVRELTHSFLRRLGYRVLQAADGGEAMQLARAHAEPIDLLLTDVVMPGINGRELAERLAPIRPEMKVVFSSGYTQDVVLHHGLGGERFDFISKPFTLRSLAEKLRSVLDRA